MDAGQGQQGLQIGAGEGSTTRLMPFAIDKFLAKVALIKRDRFAEQRRNLLAWPAILQKLAGGMNFGVKKIGIKPKGAGGVNAIATIAEGNPLGFTTQRIAGMGQRRAKAFAHLLGRGVGPEIQTDLLARAVGPVQQIEEQFARFGI